MRPMGHPLADYLLERLDYMAGLQVRGGGPWFVVGKCGDLPRVDPETNEKDRINGHRVAVLQLFEELLVEKKHAQAYSRFKLRFILRICVHGW